MIIPDYSKSIHVEKNDKNCKLFLPEFTLTNDMKNKWFLTKDSKIVGMTDIHKTDDGVSIKGKFLLSKQDFFLKPMKSSFLHIFMSKIKNNSSNVEYFNTDSILGKLAAINWKKQTVFIPLMHTVKNYK